MLRSFLLTLFLAVSLNAQVPFGASKQEVIKTLGWPDSVSRSANREILNYPDFTVLMEGGRMKNLEYKPGKRKPLSKYAPSEPKVVPNQATPVRKIAPQQGVPTTPAARPRAILPPSTYVQSPAKQPVQPSRTAVAPPRPEPVHPFSTLIRLTIYLGLFLFGAVLLKIWLRNRVKAHRNLDDIFRPVSRESPPPVSPPIFRDEPKQKPDSLKDGWSLALLREIEWHRFEHVVAAYERELGNVAELTTFGPDGGIDVHVFEPEARTPSRVIQCKAYSGQIGVDLVRSFYGAMLFKKVPRGVFYTTSTFTEAALSLARDEPNLELVDGPTFLNRIERLGLPAQLRLFDIATEGDYTTPTCPNCGIKMVRRVAKSGRNAGNDFWACPTYRCSQIINIRRT